MDRRTFVAAFGGVLVGCARIAWAQQAGKVWRVGYLAGGVPSPDGAVPLLLRNELNVLGFVEQKDVVFDGRWAEGHNERLPALAAELLTRRVDLIVAFGDPAAQAAKQTSSTVPVIALSAGDMAETGLVASLARPGGNVTGVNDPAAVLAAKRLAILKELVPTAKRMAVLWNAGNYAMTLRYREIEREAKSLGITIDPLGVREPDEFDSALAAMDRARPDALMMLTDALTNLNRQRVLDYVSSRQIPGIYEFGYVVKAGGLVSYGSDPSESLRLAARYVAKVLKGARPADLPVEQPNRYFLVINLKTARSLGLNIPPSLLVRADEVIE